LDAAAEPTRGLEQTICTGLSPDERRQLLDMLVRVSGNLGLAQGLHPAMTPGCPSSEPSKPSA
jgi:hypothetical protein